MARLKRGALAVVAVAVAALVGWALTDAAESIAFNDRLHAGTRHWTEVVDRQAPIGARRADVVQRLSPILLKETTARMLYDAAQRQLVFVPQKFEVPGFKFPCSAWMILVDIDFGPDDKVISRKVTQQGMCV